MSDASRAFRDIRSEVKQFLQREFLIDEDPAALTDSTPLITGGILDSIGAIKLVAHLEEHFGVRFDQGEVDIDHLDSVARIVRCMEQKLKHDE